MNSRYNTFLTFIFTILATWIILAAMPYFRLNGTYPQVDTQVILLHFLCGILFFYFAVLVFFKKYNLDNLRHPLIIIPFFLGIFGVFSSLLNDNPNISFSGSPQIGQGVFWYFDLTIMSIIFSQVMFVKKIRFAIFVNLLIITTFLTFFTFFPNWKGLPVSFYYFTDYLSFFGVLCFISLTTLTKKKYINISGFLILGFYFTLLENRAATLFWITSFIIALVYFMLNLLKKHNLVRKITPFLFSNIMFVFIVFLISFLILFCSIYFWPENYKLSANIKGTLLDAPVVRGKIIENSLYSLSDFKTFIFGNGWGRVPDLLLENMKVWHYDELRLGYNLHFHTHNELSEHLVSLGIIGGIFFLVYIYYIFNEASKINFLSKLGWLLFFKINCFWFLWTGTFATFAVVISSFITYRNNFKELPLKVYNYKVKSFYASITAICIGFFLFYGSYLTYQNTKVGPLLDYNAILQNMENNKKNSNYQCLSFYTDSNRGGFLLDRFLSGYSSYVMQLKIEDIDEQALKVLKELRCKANEMIKANNYTSSLLTTAMQTDTDFYYKFKNNELRNDLGSTNYSDWLYKANILAETISKRGDLLLPFFSYAINNDKITDVLKICEKRVLGIESFCYLIKASQILNQPELNKRAINNSINLIKKAIENGLFDELVYGFWFSKCPDPIDNTDENEFCHYGLKGIPLSPDVIFLISDSEKQRLENIIN